MNSLQSCKLRPCFKEDLRDTLNRIRAQKSQECITDVWEANDDFSCDIRESNLNFVNDVNASAIDIPLGVVTPEDVEEVLTTDDLLLQREEKTDNTNPQWRNVSEMFHYNKREYLKNRWETPTLVNPKTNLTVLAYAPVRKEGYRLSVPVTLVTPTDESEDTENRDNPDPLDAETDGVPPSKRPRRASQPSELEDTGNQDNSDPLDAEPDGAPPSKRPRRDSQTNEIEDTGNQEIGNPSAADAQTGGEPPAKRLRKGSQPNEVEASGNQKNCYPSDAETDAESPVTRPRRECSFIIDKVLNYLDERISILNTMHAGKRRHLLLANGRRRKPMKLERRTRKYRERFQQRMEITDETKLIATIDDLSELLKNLKNTRNEVLMFHRFYDEEDCDASFLNETEVDDLLESEYAVGTYREFYGRKLTNKEKCVNKIKKIMNKY